MIRIALASILAGALLAQEAPPPRPSVAGTVISTAGDPVRKATVLLRAQDQAGISYTADSDANGRFAIYDVQPGSYAVSADRQGFEPDTDGAPGAPPPKLKVEAGESVKDVKIKLVPLGVITGRVLDDDGDPVRGAWVQAMAYTYRSGKRQLDSVEQVAASDKGEFRIFGLIPGTFYLRASVANRGRYVARDIGAGSEGSPTPTFFPSTTDGAHAAPIEVSAGAQLRGFDIRLRREPHFSVRGKRPQVKQEGAQVMLQIVPKSGNGGGNWSVRQDNETFEFIDVLPGSYVVVGRVDEDGKTSIGRQAVEVVNADVEGVTLNLAPATEVTGVVRVEGTAPHAFENMRVTLQPETLAMFGQSSAEVKPDGSFVIPEVTPDVYEVNAVGSHPGVYMKSVRFGEAEAPDDRIDLTQGSGPLTILLGTDVGEVEGSVKNLNGDPGVRVRVTLIAYGSHLSRIDLSRSGFTDEQGKFHLRNVAPGDYRIFAWEDVPLGAPQDPEFRKPFEKQAVTVKLEPNGHETGLELTAISVKASQRPAQ